MNYVTGETIKNLREKKRITQKELADMINVSDKTISKWETNKGLPDISIIEELSHALGVSIAELLTGELKINDNPSGNMKKIHLNRMHKQFGCAILYEAGYHENNLLHRAEEY